MAPAHTETQSVYKDTPSIHLFNQSQECPQNVFGLLQDMKLQRPQHPDAIERFINEKIKSLGTVIDSTAGITDAYAKHGMLNGTIRTLLRAAVARRSNSSLNSPLSLLVDRAAGRGASKSDRGSASGAAAGDGIGKSSGNNASASKSNSLDSAAPGAKGQRRTGEVPPAVVRGSITRRMTYTQRRKVNKVRKWMDDAWLRQHIVYDTTPSRLVLGNGMMVAARARKPLLPDDIREYLEGEFSRIEDEVARSRSSHAEQPQGWAIGRGVGSQQVRKPRTTLPGVPGS
jgi:hypothetical protein